VHITLIGAGDPRYKDRVEENDDQHLPGCKFRGNPPPDSEMMSPPRSEMMPPPFEASFKGGLPV